MTCTQEAEEVVKRELNNKRFNIADLKNKIITDVNDFIIEKTGRKPIIMPVIMDIKSSDK